MDITKIDEYSSPRRVLNILIVDDNVFFRDSMVIFLQKHGFSVDMADNGHLGVKQYIDNPNKYDIIFMDIQMPLMDGNEAAKRIRRSDVPTAKTIPIVAISGKSIDDESDFDCHLSKPFQMNELISIIQKFTKFE